MVGKKEGIYREKGRNKEFRQEKGHFIIFLFLFTIKKKIKKNLLKEIKKNSSEKVGMRKGEVLLVKKRK